MVNDSFEVSLEKSTSSIPGWDFMCFTGRDMTTFPHYFPVTMLTPCDF